MKKIFLIVALFICTAPAFSQSKAFDGRISRKPINFGLRGGINFNSFGADVGRVWDWEGSPQKKAHTGWNIGFVFDCPILESLYFQPGIFYKTKGFKYVEYTSVYDHKVRGNSQWIQFPLLFSYRYTIKPGMQVEFNLGPYIGIGLAGTVDDIKYNRLPQGGFPGADDPDDPDPPIDGPEIKSMNFFGDDLENSFGVKKNDIGLTLGVGITINRFYFGVQHDFGLKNLRNEVCWPEKTVFRNGSTTILVGFNFNKHQ